MQRFCLIEVIHILDKNDKAAVIKNGTEGGGTNFKIYSRIV